MVMIIMKCIFISKLLFVDEIQKSDYFMNYKFPGVLFIEL